MRSFWVVEIPSRPFSMSIAAFVAGRWQCLPGTCSALLLSSIHIPIVIVIAGTPRSLLRAAERIYSRLKDDSTTERAGVFQNIEDAVLKSTANVSDGRVRLKSSGPICGGFELCSSLHEPTSQWRRVRDMRSGVAATTALRVCPVGHVLRQIEDLETQKAKFATTLPSCRISDPTVHREAH